MRVIFARFELQSTYNAYKSGVNCAFRAAVVVGNGVLASQTLMAWSFEPDTMVLPSGEKLMELIEYMCAFSLLALSSKVPVQRAAAA